MEGRFRMITGAVSVGMVTLGFLANLGASTTTAAPQKKQPVFRSEFRYVILSNDIESVGRKYRTRSIEVLLDPNAFSEPNLRDLFELLLNRYPKPDWMFVDVVTNLEQVATPEEAERDITMSHTDNHPEFDKYNNAILIRQGKDEFFRYTIKAPGTEMNTVVIKGCDAATKKCAH